MIIIFEGLDGVGKTTIAKQICKEYNYKYIHESYTDDVKEKELRIIDMLLNMMTGLVVVYDRTTLIDDFVYSFLNKTESTLTQYKPIIIEMLKKCKIIHLQLDEKIRKKRFEQRGDEFVSDENMKQIAEQYDLFYKDLPNVQYIEIDDDNEKNIEKIIRSVNEN